VLQKAFNNGHGQWLAVVSGRFLPVRDISVSVEQDVDMMATSGTTKKTPMQSVRETITIEFETGRDPMIRNLLSAKSEHVVLVNRKYEFFVHESTLFVTGNTIEDGPVWSLEIEGLDYELRER
jgi:hypothetical protein